MNICSPCGDGVESMKQILCKCDVLSSKKINMVSNNEVEPMSSQEARATLRETFLKTLNQLNGEPCEILTFELSKLEGKFVAWKPDGSELLVSDLKTPANITMESALLRTPDILSVTFDKSIVEFE